MLCITATDLPRLMGCNGFILLEQFISSLDEDDTGKKEGDAAHWLVEQVHKYGQPLQSMLNRQAPNGVFITTEMMMNVTEYLTDIQGIGWVEFDTTFQDVGGAWRVGGRADHTFLAPGKLIIRDFKYGWRVVEVNMNYTLIWHAIGFLLRAKAMGINYTPAQLNMVEFIVYQPRPHHPEGTKRTWSISRTQLEDIWETVEAVLKAPSDRLQTGPHCYKCPAMPNCPARVKAMNNALEVSETAFTDQVDNINLDIRLHLTSRAMEILKQQNDAYEELAKHRIRIGQIVPNHALEHVVGNAEWKPGTTGEFLQMMTGKDLTKKELVTPAAAKKLGVPEAVVKSLSNRDNKGMKLVRINADAKARKMFNQPKGK